MAETAEQKYRTKKGASLASPHLTRPSSSHNKTNKTTPENREAKRSGRSARVSPSSLSGLIMRSWRPGLQIRGLCQDPSNSWRPNSADSSQFGRCMPLGHRTANYCAVFPQCNLYTFALGTNMPSVCGLPQSATTTTTARSTFHRTDQSRVQGGRRRHLHILDTS